MRRLLLLSLIASLILVAPSLPRTGASIPSAILFAKTWGTIGIATYGKAVALDSSGNIYVAGSTYNSSIIGFPPHFDVLLLKYDSAGGLQWERSWGGTYDDIAQGVAIDSADFIYVAGYTRSFNSGGSCPVQSGTAPCPDIFLLKFDTSGNLLWQRTWGGNDEDRATGVATDNSGNVYVTGFMYSLPCGTYSREHGFLVKFNSTGNLLWQNYIGSPVSLGNNCGFYRANGVAVDSSSGIVYVTGEVNSCCLQLWKLDLNGTLIWTAGFSAPPRVFGEGVAVDPATHHVYVAGSLVFGGGLFDNQLVLRVNPLGNLLWQKDWAGSGLSESMAIAVSPKSHIFVSGQNTCCGPNSVSLLELESNGDLFSEMLWGSSASEPGEGVAVDSTGNAVVAGTVTAGPPYGSTVGNLTIPNGKGFSWGVDSFNHTGMLTFTPNNSPGTIGTPPGSETYSGGIDAFVLKYKPPVVIDAPCLGCGIISNSPISDRAFLSNRTLHFTATGTTGTTDNAMVILPKSLVANQDSSKIRVYLNGVENSSFTIGGNSTDFIISIPLTFHSSINVNIYLGQAAISLPPFLPLAALLSVSPLILRSKRRGQAKS